MATVLEAMGNSPTSGPTARMTGFSGPRGSAPGGHSSSSRRIATPAPPRPSSKRSGRSSTQNRRRERAHGENPAEGVIGKHKGLLRKMNPGSLGICVGRYLNVSSPSPAAFGGTPSLNFGFLPTAPPHGAPGRFRGPKKKIVFHCGGLRRRNEKRFLFVLFASSEAGFGYFPAALPKRPNFREGVGGGVR